MNDRELDQGVRQWERLCHKIVRKWTTIPRGLTYEDLLQEVRLGVFRGLKSFDSAQGVTLVHYLYTCGERALWAAVKRANGARQRPLNEATSGVVYDGEELSFFDRLEDDPEDRPDHVVEQALEVAALRSAIDRADLSPLEIKVLNAVLDGGVWRQIGAECGVSSEGARQVMQRVEEKLALVFDAETEVA